MCVTHVALGAAASLISRSSAARSTPNGRCARPSPDGCRHSRASTDTARSKGSSNDHSLISLLALNGLRISEALGADIESMGMDRGHRILAIVHKGGKHVTIPAGPIFLGANGQGTHGPLRR